MVKIILQPPATTPQVPPSHTRETPSAAPHPLEVSSGFESTGSILQPMMTNLILFGDMLAGDTKPRRRTHKPNTRKGR